jgi:methyl-accepting chemotaxis protein
VATAISGITGSVAQVKGLVEEVSQASQQQTQGIDQVSQAIAQIEKVTQTTAATAEESAAASEELSAQAETAMEIVKQLEVMVGGGGSMASHGATKMKKPAARRPDMVQSSRAVIAHKPKAGQWGARTAEDEIPLADTGTYGKF